MKCRWIDPIPGPGHWIGPLLRLLQEKEGVITIIRRTVDEGDKPSTGIALDTSATIPSRECHHLFPTTATKTMPPRTLAPTEAAKITIDAILANPVSVAWVTPISRMKWLSSTLP